MSRRDTMGSVSRRGRAGWSGPACALAAAAGLGLGNELTSGGNRRGFVVGLGDHVVLTPYGIHAADPQAFAGDWFTAEAPQPHWLFDVVVWAGRSAGNLPVALLLYYLLALGVFGAATAVLARRWCGGRAWVAGVASGTVGLLSAYQAIYLAGTNTLNSPLALPNVLGGALAYLFLAGLVTRRRWAPTMLPVVAAAHIQMGVLALGAGALAWCGDIWRAHDLLRARPALAGPARGPLLRAAAWWLLGAAVALFEMRLRAVATDPAAFVEICDRYIAFHCAARSWSLWQMLSTAAAAVLCLGLAVVVPRRDRWTYLLAVGVPAVGLVAAMAADRRGVPVLGHLVQAYNAYRVGNLIFPFAVWGVLAPFLPGPVGAWASRRGVLGRLGLAVLGAGATVVFSTSPGVPTEMKTGFVADRHFTTAAYLAGAVLLALTVGAWASTRPGRGGDAVRRGRGGGAVRPVLPATASAAGMAAVALAGLLCVRAAGFTGAAPAPLQWPASGAEGAWGAAARTVIAPDVQVLINPVQPNLKLALERGVVVDCKDLPYGGPAYAQWRQRLDAIGGTAQCESYAPTAYDALTGAQLDAAARRFGARAVVVAHRDGGATQAAQLVGLGYRLHRVDAGSAGLDTDILVR